MSPKVWQLRSLTLEFLGEIQTMIENDPYKSVRLIAKDIGESEFLIRQLVQKGIHYTSWESANFLLQAMKDKRKDHSAKLFNKLKHPLQTNILWFFSDEKNFSQDQMINSQSYYRFDLSPQMSWYWQKYKSICINTNENQNVLILIKIKI